MCIFEEAYKDKRVDLYIELTGDGYDDSLYLFKATEDINKYNKNKSTNGKEYIVVPIVKLINVTEEDREATVTRTISTRPSESIGLPIASCHVSDLLAEDLFSIIHLVPWSQKDYINELINKYNSLPKKKK